MKVNKKTFLPSFLSSLCLAFVSCTVKPPELIVKGVKADQALSSLENYRNNEAGQRDFSQYTRYLRDNHTLRFHWDQYWSGIKQQQLYKDIKPQDLDKLLSLNQISCKREHREAFFDLLLQIAAEEPDFLPFSRELARLQDTCSIRLSHSSFKAIVLFLSGKRDELEAPELAQEKSAWQNIQKTNSSTGKISPSGGKTTLKKQVGKTGPANAQSVLSGSGGKPAVKESESKRSKYIYTQELQKVVVEEWLRKPNFQKWKDILEPVDRDFWSDARWVNYQSKDREYLRGALEMEKNLYPSPIPGLDRDIFMMFGEKGKMADIIKAANYEKYFSAPGALDWTALWTETLLRYPEKPENGNTDSLLSLYAYSSCQGPELSAYLKLTDSWQLPNYKSLAVMFCRNLRQQAVRDTYDPGEIKKMFKEFYNSALNVFIKRAEEDAKRTEYEVLDEALSAPPKKEVFAGISVITQKPGARTVREMASLLSTYKKERRFHPKQKWRVLLEKHFLERDWLNLMSLSRRWGDRANVEAVLNMHHDLYNGQISFLAKDVEEVLKSEWLSPSELSKKYGYPEIYLESSGALFFQSLKADLAEDPGALVKVLPIYREQRGSSEKERLKKSLQIFSEEDWLNLTAVLRKRGDRSNIEAVLSMHHDLYDGQVSFLAKDMTTALRTEGISLEDLTEKYGYPKVYLESAGAEGLFFQNLKDSLGEDPGALVRVLPVYEKARHSNSERGRLKASLQIFSEEDWLNLTAVLRKRGDRSNIEAVLSMHHDLYDGQISFLAKDMTTALRTEGISLEDLTEKYGYPKVYLESAGAGALFFQNLKDSLEEDPGALVKILPVYEKARHTHSEKERLKVSLQIFSEEDWLNLMRVLRKRGDRANIEAVLNMHHDLYGGQIAFLAKDMTTALGTEGISLEDLTEKYGYPKVYLESAGAEGLFFQSLKADLEEDPGALVKVLPIYRERWNKTGEKEKLKVSFDSHFSAEDWLNLMRVLRERKDRANIEAVLNMHHDLYNGQISFLAKDVKAVLNSEWLSPTELSKKYGYPEIYLEEWSVNVLFFHSLKADLGEDPGALVKVLPVYEKARHTHSEKERLKASLQVFSEEEDWLNLMRVLRERRDRSNIEAVLDMHHDLYGGQISFLAKDLEAILLSKKKFSLSGLTDRYGYKAVYINKQEVRSRFWQQVSGSMDKDVSFNPQTAFQEGVEVCDYPYIRDLHFFFSEVNREDILIDQFRFNDCADFIKKFRDKEWDRLTALVQRGAGPFRERAGSDFVWWLARVLSLYSGEEDFVVKEAVSQIGVSEYRDIVTDLLASYAEKKPETETYLFQETLKKIKQVYGREMDTTLCSFFVEEENSSLFIQERGPEQLMDLLRDLSWVKIPYVRTRRGKKTCAELVPEKRRNALLYELAQSLLDKQGLEGQNLSLSDSIVEIWSVTAQIISLSVQMNSLEKSDIWSLSLKALFKRRSEMSDYDFYLRFSGLTLERLLSVAKNDKTLLLNHLKDGVWGGNPPTAYHAVYRDWIENALIHNPHPLPPSGVIYVPLPPFGLNQKKKPAPDRSQRVPSVFSGGLKKSAAGRSPKKPSPVSGFKKKISPLEKVFHRVSRPSAGALSADVRDKLEQPTGWRETGSLRKIQSEPAPDDAKVDYEQIFLEETADSYDLDYEISVFGGMAVWGNPYISARFAGLEVKKRVQSLLYLGLEYSHYKSKISSTMSAFENLYGVDVSYPLVKDAFYIKGYYKLFKSHLNLAGVFKIKLDVPLQIGVGAVNTKNIKTKKRNRHLSLQWGTGPRIQWGSRWGTQLLLSQSVSAEKFDFLHTWCSLVLVFGF